MARCKTAVSSVLLLPAALYGGFRTSQAGVVTAIVDINAVKSKTAIFFLIEDWFDLTTINLET